MKIIAHRGNTSGPSDDENHPKHISLALHLGFEVEVDVWYQGGKFYLGHDKPQYEIPETFLSNPGLWCHAKNIDALNRLVSLGSNCFWHEMDDATLTLGGYMWTYPGIQLTEKSICVMPESASYSLEELVRCAGVCSDYPFQYQTMLEKVGDEND